MITSTFRLTGGHPEDSGGGRMRGTRVWSLAVALAMFPVLASAQMTALQALKKLPASKAAGVARIIGNDGTPQPERWHFIVSEPAEPTGFLEYVVANGEVVASRNLSQFAERIDSSEVIGKENLLVDSDRAAAMAQDYAFANDLVITRIDFRLAKEGADASPVWHVTCYGDEGHQVGKIGLTASKGTVVAQEGFAVAPKEGGKKEASPAGFDTFAEAEVASPAPSPTERPVAKRRSKSRDDDDEPSGPGRAFRKVGGKLQKFFTGRDTISR